MYLSSLTCLLYCASATPAAPTDAKPLTFSVMRSVGIYGYHKNYEKKIDFCESDFKSFDAGAWKALALSTSRVYMFSLLLRDFDLIGMKQDDLLKLCADPDIYELADYQGNFCTMTYMLKNGGYALLGWKVHFQNGKVDRWCFCHQKIESAPITANVVMTGNANDLSNARIGGRSEPDFPKTEAKHR